MAQLPLFAQEVVTITSQKGLDVFSGSSDGGLFVNGQKVAAGTGCACYFHTDNDNVNVPVGTPFLIDQLTQSSIPDAVELMTHPTLGGSLFKMKQLGNYAFDFESLFTTPAVFGMYVGPEPDSMAPIGVLSAGSKVAGTWIHGRICGGLPAVPWYVYFSPFDVPLTVDALQVGNNLIRCVIEKIN